MSTTFYEYRFFLLLLLLKAKLLENEIKTFDIYGVKCTNHFTGNL